MTDAERVFWNKVRRRQIDNLHFYRQKPIGRYIVDFFCPKRNLIIEIDGGQHYESFGKIADKIRDEYFKNRGFKVLRFTNREILKNLEGVMLKLLSELNPSHPPFTKGKGKCGQILI